MSDRTIEIAEKAGSCYGVNRALDMAYACAKPGVSAHTLGPLIHNPRVVADLAAAGVSKADSLDDIDDGIVVIRSHGTSPATLEAAAAKGLEVVDATCPFVSKVQLFARDMRDEGRGVVVVGEEGHAEVEGICAWGEGGIIAVVEIPDQLPAELPARVGVVAQTTQTAERFDAVVAALRERCDDVVAHKTICNATQQRQQAAADLAARADVMVIIGGRNSGNTKRLFEICSAVCPSYHIEDAAELEPAWFENASLIGITAGASTPQAHIDDVVNALEAM